MGSADMMPRNLDRRVEVIFPIEDSRLRQYLMQDLFDAYFADNIKARHMLPDGSYVRYKRKEGEEPFNCQLSFIGGKPSWETQPII